jgi:hypothetical protein
MSQKAYPRAPASPGAFIPFLGASLLSATGSLPMHLMPLIIAAIIADGKVSVVEAGWLASARAIGELLVSLMLPAIGALQLSWAAIAVGSASLLLAVLAAASGSLAVIVVSFFIIGACSGGLKFAGTMSAAAYHSRSFAFLFRLALILALAGTTICCLFAMRAYASYEIFLRQFALWMLPALVCGGLLYRPATAAQTVSTKEARAISAGGLTGLAVVYLFFLGISGFMTFMAQQALSRGLSLQELVLGFGAMKFVAGAWLFVAAYGLRRRSRAVIGGFEAAGLAAALWIAYLSTSTALFLAGFLLLEITLNGMSAHLQARAVETAPESAKWLNCVILLGFASGPPLNGIAIGLGSETAFIVLSTITVLLPVLWQQLGDRR